MSVAMGLGAVALSTAVLFGYLLFIWWLDRYEREPFWMVIVTFLWGALGGTLLGCGVSLAMSATVGAVISETYANFFDIVVIAAVVEEFTKGLIFLGLLFTTHLDNETDGLIYGAAVGLGFATVENLLYFATTAVVSPDVFFATVVMRTLFSALVHTISSAILGYCIGYIRHRKLTPWLWLLAPLGYVLAVVHHGAWNLAASLGETGLVSEGVAAGAYGLAMLMIIVMSLMMFVLTQISLDREKRIIRRYLEEEAKAGVLPPAHAQIIPSWRKRRKSGWLAPSIPKDDYARAASLLAFRRYQADTAAPRFKEKYEADVEKQRQKVRSYHQDSSVAAGGLH